MAPCRPALFLTDLKTRAARFATALAVHGIASNKGKAADGGPVVQIICTSECKSREGFFEAALEHSAAGGHAGDKTAHCQQQAGNRKNLGSLSLGGLHEPRAKSTWILHEDFSRGHNMTPI